MGSPTMGALASIEKAWRAYAVVSDVRVGASREREPVRQARWRGQTADSQALGREAMKRLV
jgi:hypothetical protein